LELGLGAVLLLISLKEKGCVTILFKIYEVKALIGVFADLVRYA
tara:strand:- start:245 stop:376 length:132 start_codon:yes stop_codon:yes gene_type:complete